MAANLQQVAEAFMAKEIIPDIAGIFRVFNDHMQQFAH
jgi:hypothetical protein